MIHQLKNDGLSISEIARRLAISRPTVHKYLRHDSDNAERVLQVRRASKLDPFRRYIEARLEAYPELSARRLQREIAERGYQGGYSILADFIAQVRPKARTDFEIRFETAPGHQAQVDFATFTVTFLDEPELTRRICLFAMVLGYSRRLWGEFCLRQNLATVIEKHISAFEAFDGTPRQVVYDRMKTAVTGQDDQGRVIYNQTLLSLLHHYGATPWACQPYRAKTKGKIERNFSYVRSSFFVGSQFENLDHLNHQFARWLTEVSDQRVHGTTGKIVAQMFDTEQPALQRLPKMPYQASVNVARKVNREGMVAYLGNWYSIPDDIDSRIVEVQALPFELRIVDQGKVIGSHRIVDGNRGERVIDPAHRRVRHSSRKAESQRQLSHSSEVSQRSLSVYQAVGRQLAAQWNRVDP